MRRLREAYPTEADGGRGGGRDGERSVGGHRPAGGRYAADSRGHGDGKLKPAIDVVAVAAAAVAAAAAAVL
jgi:hypothetical protein